METRKEKSISEEIVPHIVSVWYQKKEENSVIKVTITEPLPGAWPPGYGGFPAFPRKQRFLSAKNSGTKDWQGYSVDILREEIYRSKRNLFAAGGFERAKRRGVAAIRTAKQVNKLGLRFW